MDFNFREHYLAYKLDEECKKTILELFPPKHSKVYCHHVTIEFNLTDEKYYEISPMLKGEVEIVGYAEDENIEALAILLNGRSQRLDGSFYHLTHSLNPPKKPVDSNKLKDKIKLLNNKIKLTGEFCLLKK